MSVELLQKLDEKIDSAIETINFMQLQIQELEEKNAALLNKQSVWEKSLNLMIGKLEEVEVL